MRGAIVMIGLMFALLVMPASGADLPQKFDTARGLLEYTYAPYSTGKFDDDNNVLYSKGLKALFAADAARTPEGGIGAIDFDIFVNAQDYQLSELKIGEPMPEGDSGNEVTVLVTFKNFNVPQSLIFHLVKENDGWKINDIQSITPGNKWRLSDLLAGDANAG